MYTFDCTGVVADGWDAAPPPVPAAAVDVEPSVAPTGWE